METREADAVKEVRQATQLVENAILEKDQAVSREGQAKEEVKYTYQRRITGGMPPSFLFQSFNIFLEHIASRRVLNEILVKALFRS